MGFRKRDKLQKHLPFDPPPQISLPASVRREAVATLATLIVAVMESTDRIADEGGNDDARCNAGVAGRPSARARHGHNGLG